MVHYNVSIFNATASKKFTQPQNEFKGELQRQNKLISFESPFKILQNETKIIKIGQAVLKIFNFKGRDLEILREKTTEKPKMLFFRSFAKTEEQ